MGACSITISSPNIRMALKNFATRRAPMIGPARKRSGLPREALVEAAEVYARSNAVIGIYGMGLTQHRAGVDNCKMLANLLLLRR